MDTYLDEAIETYRKITSLDFTIYSEFVYEYLQNKGIETIEDINLFQQLAQYDVMDNRIFCERKRDGSYSIEPNFLPNGVELFVNKTKIEKEVNELNPSVLRSTLASILSKIDYIKQVRERFPLLQSEIDHDKYIEVLNKLEENQKQVLIYLSLIKGSEKLRDKIIEDWNIQIFSYLSKSILNAEYLIFDDYKTKLDEIESLFDEKDEVTNEVSRKIGRFYTEKAFLRVSWYLQEACSVIKRYLSDNQETNLLLVNSDRKKRFRRKEIYKNKYLGGEKTKIYEMLLESIIEMTVIDHYFKSDAETVEKLFHLYEQVKGQNGNKTLSDNILYKEVIDEVLAKVATMLDLILNNKFHKHTEPQIDVDYYYIINSRKSKDDFIINELAPYCKRDTSENPYISEKKKHEGDIFNFKEEKFPHNEESFSDLKLYHHAVITGMSAYQDQSMIISKIHHCSKSNCDCAGKCILQAANENIENNTTENADEATTEFSPSTPKYTEQEVVDAIKQFIDKQPTNLSPSFFRQVLEFINNLIEKESNPANLVEKGKTSKIREYHILLKKVLDMLFIFLNRFVSDIPFSHRPYFESSFYSCSPEKGIIYKGIDAEDIKGYKKEMFKDKFFFASIDCMPINYLYMSKLYNQYKIKYKEQRYNFDEESRKNLRDEFERLSKDVTNKLDTETSNVQTQVNKALEDNKTLVNNKLEETSKELTSKNLEHMIVSLGIFAAFIAFVTISINLVKVAQNIWQYIVFSCTFTICLLLFVIYLKHGETIMSHIKAKIGGSWTIRRILKYLFTVSLVASIIIGTLVFTSKLPVFNSDLKLRNQDSIINSYLNRERQMSEDYKMLLKDYKVLKEKNDSLQLSIPPLKDTQPKDLPTKRNTK